jgi:Sulfotransferase domain
MARLPGPAKRALRPARRRFRYATRKRRILPSFLIIGAQRAGTTSLFRYLLRHPDVAGPTGGDSAVWWVKETHFFDEKFTRGVDWYRSFFPLGSTRERYRRRGHDLLAGEATPYYMFHPAVPARVAAILPDVRLIALLRDPVERAYSHYQMMSRTGREKLTFEEALAAEPERLAGVEEALMAEAETYLPSGSRAHHQHRHRAYLSRGLYAEQLERWLGHFARKQLLVLKTEDLLARPAETYAGVLSFLGLRDWRLDDFPEHNKKPYSAIDPAVRARLEERYAEPNERLAELLGWPQAWGAPSSAKGLDLDGAQALAKDGALLRGQDDG